MIFAKYFNNNNIYTKSFIYVNKTAGKLKKERNGRNRSIINKGRKFEERSCFSFFFNKEGEEVEDIIL